MLKWCCACVSVFLCSCMLSALERNVLSWCFILYVLTMQEDSSKSVETGIHMSV